MLAPVTVIGATLPFMKPSCQRPYGLTDADSIVHSVAIDDTHGCRQVTVESDAEIKAFSEDGFFRRIPFYLLSAAGEVSLPTSS